MEATKNKQSQFNEACEYVRELIRADFGVEMSILKVSKHYGNFGLWDADDLRIELGCMGYCEVDSYND